MPSSQHCLRPEAGHLGKWGASRVGHWCLLAFSLARCGVASPDIGSGSYDFLSCMLLSQSRTSSRTSGCPHRISVAQQRRSKQSKPAQQQQP